MRDASVVDNYVVCPACKTSFCWICLEKVNDNHFDDENLFHCPGKQYQDVRNMRGLTCDRICLILQMPWINIYFNTKSYLQKINGYECYQKCNCFLSLIIRVIVNLIMAPFVIIFYGILGGIIYSFVSIFC